MSLAGGEIVPGKPADTAQECEGDLGISLRIFKHFDFRQAAVGNHQPGFAIRDIREGTLRDFGPGLLHPGIIEGGKANSAFDHFEMPILAAGCGGKWGGKVDAQAVIPGGINERCAYIHTRHTICQGNGGSDGKKGLFTRARLAAGSECNGCF